LTSAIFGRIQLPATIDLRQRFGRIQLPTSSTKTHAKRLTRFGGIQSPTNHKTLQEG
jgi:hypothetical protein